MDNKEFNDFVRQFWCWYRIFKPGKEEVISIKQESLKEIVIDIIDSKNLNWDVDKYFKRLLEQGKRQGLIYQENDNYGFLVSEFTASLSLRLNTKFSDIGKFVYNVLEKIQKREMKKNPILSNQLKLIYKIDI